MENETYYWGTLRVTNPKTLERWVQNGQYQAELDAGYTYGPGCGRFVKEGPCTCCRCRKTGSEHLQARLLVIKRHYKDKNNKI